MGDVIRFPVELVRAARFAAPRGRHGAPVDGMSYAEIASILGVTPARVMQIERRALRKLQRTCDLIGLGADLLVEDAR